MMICLFMEERMYYKIICNSKIIDVLSDDNLTYVRHDQFSKFPLRCKANEDPFGVLSSDLSEIYAIVDTEGYGTVTLKEFYDAEEYETLKAEIESSRYVEYTEEEETEEVDVSAYDHDITAAEALDIILGVTS